VVLLRQHVDARDVLVAVVWHDRATAQRAHAEIVLHQVMTGKGQPMGLAPFTNLLAIGLAKALADRVPKVMPSFGRPVAVQEQPGQCL